VRLVGSEELLMIRGRSRCSGRWIRGRALTFCMCLDLVPKSPPSRPLETNLPICVRVELAFFLLASLCSLGSDLADSLWGNDCFTVPRSPIPVPRPRPPSPVPLFPALHTCAGVHQSPPKCPERSRTGPTPHQAKCPIRKVCSKPLKRDSLGQREGAH